LYCDNISVFFHQVHNRSEYLSHLVNSLRSVRGIEQTLLIFSHDVYSGELNSIVASVDFCPVSQMIRLQVVIFCACYFNTCCFILLDNLTAVLKIFCVFKRMFESQK